MSAMKSASLLIVAIFSLCSGYSRPPETIQTSAEKIADLEEEAVRESSGLAASRRNRGILWTHNDSGDGPFIYAFDAGGRKRGVWRVTGARARDWEDMAVGPGPKRGASYIYIGDIGNNGLRTRELTIYRIPEPAVVDADALSSTKSPRQTESAEAFRFVYPAGAHDAEALLVHPLSGDLYIVTKPSSGGSPLVFKASAPLRSGPPVRLKQIASLKLASPPFDIIAGKITGGDISPDGLRVVLCDYLQGYEFRLPRAAGFDAIWKQRPRRFNLGQRRQGEAVAFSADGKSILATSEGSPCPLIRTPVVN
ncbi:MAG: hypothetical protein AB7H86_09395 [Blastocatellales bacterium]